MSPETLTRLAIEHAPKCQRILFGKPCSCGSDRALCTLVDLIAGCTRIADVVREACAEEAADHSCEYRMGSYEHTDDCRHEIAKAIRSIDTTELIKRAIFPGRNLDAGQAAT